MPLAVGCDLIGRPKAARALGALTSLLGSYLGSYTGVLLACTAVPLWSGSRTILGPAFVATATATGAAATRLVLVASGLPDGHPTRRALGTIETASMLTELSISALGERRLGDAASALGRGRPGVYFRTAKTLVALGISLRLVARRTGPREHELASVMYLAAGLLFRFAWVYAGKPSAEDDEVVAAMARVPTRSARRPPAAMAARALSSRPLPDGRFRPSCRGRTARRSGARASRSSGGYGADRTVAAVASWSSPNTASAPAATGDPIRRSSISTAIGVPPAANARIASPSGSSSTWEWKP